MAGDADRQFEKALDHHRNGRLEEAAALYQAILRVRPKDADALYLLGVIAHQNGEPARAVDLLRQSLAILPNQVRCYSVLGPNLMALDRPDEAEDSLQRAIALEPSAELYNNLAALWMQQGRLDEAIDGCRKALAVDPGYVPVHYNLGSVWRLKGDLAQAAECLQRAVDGDPEHAAARAALGEVHCELGDALQTRGDLAGALQAYRRSLKLDPALSRAWYAAGCAESSLKEFTAAAACFQKALEAAPDWPEAQHNLGRALFKLGQVEAALDWFRRAAAAGDPALPLAAIALVIPGDPGSGNQAVLEARRRWAESQLPPPSATAPRAQSGRLKIGYLSSFFPDRNWMKPVWALINQHDRERFEIHLFSDAPPAKIQHGYRADPRDRMHDVTGLSNAALAERIGEAEIDLLIDLNGYSAMERLPAIALRPAPVIAGWFNIYATTGMPAYDYLIGDQHAIPAEEEKFYCEKIIRVPGSYLTFEVTYPVPDVVDPPCLAGGAVTFGSLAPLYKITGAAVAAWSAILLRVPGSLMVIKNRELGSAGARQFLEGLFGRQGVGPERLRLEGPAEHYRFLETYGAIDIALDTFPYNGGTTTTEAIWQGVPVATFSGDRWVSRTSASILHAGGLEELVGQGAGDFVDLAVRLAGEPERLADLRRNMRERLSRSPVCDTQAFARHMERLYGEMCAGGLTKT